MVFCEGKNSEPDYVNGLRRLRSVADNTALNIIIHPEQGAPLTLVQMAVERKQDPEIDECWCLFDVEWPQHHPNLAAARDLANAHDIKLGISNPCFEIWLILHHRDHPGFITTDDAVRASRNLDKRKGKSIDATSYLPTRKDAARRAALLEARHQKNQTIFPHDNPSSGMHRFLEAVEGKNG